MNRSIFPFAAAILLALTVSGCESNESESPRPPVERQAADEKAAADRTLIVEESFESGSLEDRDSVGPDAQPETSDSSQTEP